MNETRSLCAQIPADLHDKVRGEKERAGKTLNQYITDFLTEYYRQREKGGKHTEIMRTLAFQITVELFQRIKARLSRESASRGEKLTQREFILELIENELSRVQAEIAAETPTGAENPHTEENTPENDYE